MIFLLYPSQVEGETPAAQQKVTNIYKLQHGVLASCKLRKAHTFLLMISQGQPDYDDYRMQALKSAKEGVLILRECLQTDSPIMAELNFHCGVLMHGSSYI